MAEEEVCAIPPENRLSNVTKCEKCIGSNAFIGGMGFCTAAFAAVGITLVMMKSPGWISWLVFGFAIVFGSVTIGLLIWFKYLQDKALNTFGRVVIRRGRESNDISDGNQETYNPSIDEETHNTSDLPPLSPDAPTAPMSSVKFPSTVPPNLHLDAGASTSAEPLFTHVTDPGNKTRQTTEVQPPDTPASDSRPLVFSEPETPETPASDARPLVFSERETRVIPAHTSEGTLPGQISGND